MAIQKITFPEVDRPAVEISVLNGDGESLRIPKRRIAEKSIAFDAGLASELIQSARQAAESAYAPYSNFRVGAAVVMKDDRERTIFSGCNVENASYGATVCAERNAIFKAAAEGFRRISLLALSTIDSLEGPLEGRSPCGVCRQVIREFADDETLIVIDTSDAELIGEVLDMDRLLPYGFALPSGNE